MLAMIHPEAKILWLSCKAFENTAYNGIADTILPKDSWAPTSYPGHFITVNSFHLLKVNSFCKNISL